MKEWGSYCIRGWELQEKDSYCYQSSLATAAFPSVAQCKTDFPTIKGNLSPLHFEKEEEEVVA